MNFRGEGEITMSVIGDVTSSSLTLPGFGEEGNVYIPGGLHAIELNASSDDDDLAWLLVQMGGGTAEESPRMSTTMAASMSMTC